MKNVENWLISGSYILEFVLQKRKTVGLCSHRLFCIYVCMYIYICTYVYTYVCIYVCMYECTFVYVHVCTHQ